MSARKVCSGTRPSRNHSVRAISAPFRRPRHADLHAQRADAHRAHHGALHRAAEHHALLDLLRDAVGDELRVELGLADLGDVEAHVVDRHAEHLAQSAARSFSMSSPFLPITMPGRAVWIVMLTFLAARSIWMRLTEASASFFLQELAHAEIRVHEHAGTASCRHTTSTPSRA